MNITKITDYTRGWFIGNFEPSLLKTSDFEVGLLTHKKGEYWAPHYHKESVEYNVLVTGKMTVQGKVLNSGDVFAFQKGEVADPVFHEDCTLVVVKVPSIPSDKFEVEQ
jgi:quercetin dioxygenase-like cupin family protein